MWPPRRMRHLLRRASSCRRFSRRLRDASAGEAAMARGLRGGGRAWAGQSPLTAERGQDQTVTIAFAATGPRPSLPPVQAVETSAVGGRWGTGPQSARGRLAHRGVGTGAAAQGCETCRGTHPRAGARWERLQVPGRGRTGVWAAPLTAHRAWHGWLQRPPALPARPYLRPTAHTHCACAPPHAGLDSDGNTRAHLSRAAAVSLLRPTRPLRIGGSLPELGRDRAKTGEAGDASLRTAAPRNACREQWFQRRLPPGARLLCRS